MKTITKILCLGIFIFIGCNGATPTMTTNAVTESPRLDGNFLRPKNKCLKEIPIGGSLWTMKSSIWVMENGTCWVDPTHHFWSLETDKSYEIIQNYVIIKRTGENEVSMEVHGKEKFLTTKGTPFQYWKVQKIVVKD